MGFFLPQEGLQRNTLRVVKELSPIFRETRAEIWEICLKKQIDNKYETKIEIVYEVQTSCFQDSAQ